ncbi:MAG: hypothetical protein A2X56_13585 [Nitrospirae bacterium GWC2_57_13]|jgi:hypothetical protein|nr:MAG: hypothetical protein A2X56_13585 [Nitrospirae bacterium GWC2_57_13]OGW46749.1 MAG: hypothetical protein A2X57_05825 [Nitrospirae bacterium GWD2_57_8]HAS53666.1 hypothetical protein [Nitrospiraceae bacterium]
MGYFVVLIIAVALFILFSRSSESEQPRRRQGYGAEEEGWEYGDVWKEGSPEQAVDDDGVTYVEVLRTDTGHGFDDAAMMEMVGRLSVRGIKATYDSFSVGLEGAAIKTYTLKVESGREAEALEHLKGKAGS